MSKDTGQLSLFETFKTSNATVTELRVGIFAPITQITATSAIQKAFIEAGRVRKVETAWGSVQIKGNILTQIHRDVIDAIFSTATYSETTSKGNIALFFSGYEVQEFLGRKSKTNNTWLKKKLDQIKTTNVEFTDKTGNTHDFNLTDSGGYSVKKDSFVIVFTEGYMNFFQKQVSVNYKNEMKKLMDVGDALIKAMIRFFFTHANGMSIELINLLDVLGYPTNIPASLKKARRVVREHTLELEEFGITVDLKRWMFKYKKLTSVTHNIPANKKISNKKG
ncbi:MAG: hypothetical protein Q9M43_07350 [Sulfurimonas sp.]|nr:hypothetical protein [Sulfurimonas sp.]